MKPLNRGWDRYRVMIEIEGQQLEERGWLVRGTYISETGLFNWVRFNQAQQYRAMGDQEHALRDLYHVLLHYGSTHEGFENLVVPWATRTPEIHCPPPHAWAAAKTALFIRNMLVCEYGGDYGIEAEERDLYLYSLVSPSWIEPGRQVAIRNAPTGMGNLSSVLAFNERGATLTVDSRFHHPPRYLVFRIPYGVELDTFTSDARNAFRQGETICFTPNLTRALIRWRARPGTHDRNYQRILESYRRELVKEYGRRFEKYVAEGGTPYPVEPPVLLSSAEREQLFTKAFGSIAPPSIRWKATASASLASYPAWKAIDGVEVPDRYPPG